jgi:hypothetical protein
VACQLYSSCCVYSFSRRLIRCLLSSECWAMTSSHTPTLERPAIQAIKAMRVEIGEQVETSAHIQFPEMMKPNPSPGDVFRLRQNSPELIAELGLGSCAVAST